MEIEELKKLKIVLDNALISVMAKMSRSSLILFQLVLAVIDVKNPPKDNIVTLDKKTIIEAFEMQKDTAKYTTLNKAVKELHRDSVFELTSENDGDRKTSIVSGFHETDWTAHGKKVHFKVSDKIMSRFIDVKENFTQYELGQILKLTSKYSILFYLILVSNYRKYSAWDEKKACHPKISMETLRAMTGTEDKYKRFTHFEMRVLEPAMQEVSEKTDLCYSYEKVTYGKAITDLIFNVEPVAALEKQYKLGTSMQTEEQKQLQRAEIARKARASKITKQMFQAQMLTFEDLNNDDLMIEAYGKLLPRYEEFQKRYGAQELEKHLNYTGNEVWEKEHTEGFIEYKVNYLLTCLKRYKVK